jgi:hypothetical protein
MDKTEELIMPLSRSYSCWYFCNKHLVLGLRIDSVRSRLVLAALVPSLLIVLVLADNQLECDKGEGRVQACVPGSNQCSCNDLSVRFGPRTVFDGDMEGI